MMTLMESRHGMESSEKGKLSDGDDAVNSDNFDNGDGDDGDDD